MFSACDIRPGARRASHKEFFLIESICGYSQRRLLKLGLKLTHLLLLDWFDSLPQCNPSPSFVDLGIRWYWVSSHKVMMELPSLMKSERVVRKRLKELCGEHPLLEGLTSWDYPLMKREVHTQKGVRVYFAHRAAHQLMLVDRFQFRG